LRNILTNHLKENLPCFDFTIIVIFFTCLSFPGRQPLYFPPNKKGLRAVTTQPQLLGEKQVCSRKPLFLWILKNLPFLWIVICCFIIAFIFISYFIALIIFVKCYFYFH
jgi:hypothetical protein